MMDWKYTFRQKKALYLKEFRSNFYSLSAIVFMFLFLSINGSLLWIVSGEYNIAYNGYATLKSFFTLSPILFLFLIPALSMRTLAEEKRLETLTLLRSRPVSILSILTAKTTALFTMVLITLIPTLIYAICIHFYGNPTGNIDWGATGASYIGLLFLSLAFICISVFASSVTSNQVIALIIGTFLCAFFYFGFDLVGLERLGLLSHYQSVQRGLIESRDCIYFIIIGTLFYIAAAFFLSPAFFRENGKNFLYQFLLHAIILTAGWYYHFRLDFTKDKRYTVHKVSKEILQTLQAPLEIDIYLTGNLNSGFVCLKEATINLLSDFEPFSPQKITCHITDPYRQGKDFMEQLNKNNMRGISVKEQLENGRTVQNTIFPYVLIKYKEQQIPVCLLVNRQGYSGVDNLNLSTEMLEYKFIHALRLLTQTNSRRIVFLEGHGEFSEESVSDITEELSYEYTIDRGTLSGKTGELDIYDLVIVAGAQLPFSESDKLVLDQYLMQGGRLLWFINGIQLHSYEELLNKGKTICKSNDLNLNDLFFTYGFRINPVVLQDVHSLNIPIVVRNKSNETNYIPKPWYYAPLLQPNPQMTITKDLSAIKTEFASTLSFTEYSSQSKEILLSTSPYAHTIQTPAVISLEETERKADKQYFNEDGLPIAALLHAPFISAFKNRIVSSKHPVLTQSHPSAQMIVVASEEIIHNPLGYDRYSQIQFANREFIMNCVDYLTDHTGISALKNKSLQMQLLDKSKLQNHYRLTVVITVILPPMILLFICIGMFVGRKRKYSTKVN